MTINTLAPSKGGKEQWMERRDSSSGKKSGEIIKKDMMRGRIVNMEVKKGLQDSMIILSLTNARETWMWLEIEESGIQGVAMGCLRVSCGVRRLDAEMMKEWTV